MSQSKPKCCEVQNATLGVKFVQETCILDEWYIMGGTRWTRMLYRLKHPIIYSKRGLRNLYRRIRRIFIKDRMTPCKPYRLGDLKKK